MRTIPLFTHRFGPPQAWLGEEGHQWGTDEVSYMKDARRVSGTRHVALTVASRDGSGIVDSVSTPAF